MKNLIKNIIIYSIRPKASPNNSPNFVTPLKNDLPRLARLTFNAKSKNVTTFQKLLAAIALVATKKKQVCLYVWKINSRLRENNLPAPT